MKIDIRSGLAAAARRNGSRSATIPRRSTAPARATARERLADPKLAAAALQPEPQAAPRQGRDERVADALRAPRHHHAGDGIHRDSREPASGRAL